MEQKFERVRDAKGEPIPWLYVRQVANRDRSREFPGV